MLQALQTPKHDRPLHRQLRPRPEGPARRHASAAVDRAIDAAKAATNASDIPQLTKMTGYTIYYRIRVGDYRLGITIEGDTVTFLRFLPRDQIYSQFP